MEGLKKAVLGMMLIMSAMLMISAEGTLSDAFVTELLAAAKDKHFESPDELRNYLNNLSHYYAVVGRPRFGKRTVNDDLYIRKLKAYLTEKIIERIDKMPDEYFYKFFSDHLDILQNNMK